MTTRYERLLLAADKLKGWQSAAQVSRGLTLAGYKVSEQMMTNWQTRGVSANGCLNASKILGCRAQWLADNAGEMTDVINHRISQDSPSYSTLKILPQKNPKQAAIDELSQLANNLDILRLGMLIKTARDLVLEMPVKQTQQSSD